MLIAYQDKWRTASLSPIGEGLKMNGSKRLRVVAGIALAVLAFAGVGSASASDVAMGNRSPAAVSYGSRAPARVQYSHVEVNGLRFRARASSRGTVRGLLYRGDRVEIVGWSGPWMHVRLTGRSRGGYRSGATGWVAKRYLYGPSCHHSHASWPCTAWR